MGPAGLIGRRGFFSVLQYRSDPSRDEARNLALLLVDEPGGYAAVKAAPIGAVCLRLRDQGIVDSLLVGLARSLTQDSRNGFERLTSLHSSLQDALSLSEPRTTAIIGDPSATLDALYKALVAPRSGRGPGLPKSRLLDQIVQSFRTIGAPVRRGAYLGDFLFDAVVQPTDRPPLPIHALSFDQPNRDWSGTEREVGHFLFAVDRLRTAGVCVLQGPTQRTNTSANCSLERITRWMDESGVRRIVPEEVRGLAGSFAPEEQLPLLMS